MVEENEHEHTHEDEFGALDDFIHQNQAAKELVDYWEYVYAVFSHSLYHSILKALELDK